MQALSYRVLTSWIGDIGSRPRMGARWPMVDLDDGLVRDYLEFIDMAADWGYNGLVAWGLFTAHNWPVDLSSCLDAERKRRVLRIFDHAARRNLTLYAGLGIYSWGFEEIARRYPHLCRGEQVKAWGEMRPHNGDALCFHEMEARAWMRRIVDFIVRETDAPGFQLQPFDKGRCMCEKCRQMDDATYFSALCGETASYIKGRWPDKKVAVSGWGMFLDRETDLEPVKRMAASIDYLCDVTNSSLAAGRDFRRSLAAALPCALGDSAGGSVTPPQTWERLRWYLPHIRHNGAYVRLLSEDGGRACEVFGGPLANPGTRVSLMALGRLLNDPGLSAEEAASEACGALYGATGATARELAEWTLRAEDAYFDHLAPDWRGDLLFEELSSAFPSRPLYLLGRERAALAAYGRGLDEARAGFAALRGRVRGETALIDTLCALQSARCEVDEVLRGFWV